MKIPLSQGKFALIDPEDYELVKNHTWCLSSNGYAVTNIRDAETKKYKQVKMHRLIFGAERGQMIDHKNGNKLDNRRENLRPVTMSQNCQNKLPKTGHKYKGVLALKIKKGVRWVARIKANGKNILIGRFLTEEEAAQAYNEKAIELFGEFAKINQL